MDPKWQQDPQLIVLTALLQQVESEVSESFLIPHSWQVVFVSSPSSTKVRHSLAAPLMMTQLRGVPPKLISSTITFQVNVVKYDRKVVNLLTSIKTFIIWQFKVPKNGVTALTPVHQMLGILPLEMVSCQSVIMKLEVSNLMCQDLHVRWGPLDMDILTPVLRDCPEITRTYCSLVTVTQVTMICLHTTWSSISYLVSCIAVTDWIMAP